MGAAEHKLVMNHIGEIISKDANVKKSENQNNELTLCSLMQV